MLAVDTNIVVRYLIGDDPHQTALARTLVDDHEVFVPITVLLETEWVLRDTYGLSRANVADALTDFVGLPQVQLRDPISFHQALAWSAAGLDLADAIHLAAARDCEAFLTFDKAMIKASRSVSAVPVRAP